MKYRVQMKETSKYSAIVEAASEGEAKKRFMILYSEGLSSFYTELSRKKVTLIKTK